MTSLRNRVGTEKEILSKQASTHWHPEEDTSCNCSQPTARAKSSASDTRRGEGSWSFSSAQFSCSVVSDSFPPHGLQQARLPCPSPTPGACSNSSIELVMPSNYLILCHPLLLLPSIFPNIRVFPMSQFFASCGQNIGASASVLPMNIQDWFPLGWTGLISLQSKGLSKVFSNTTVQNHYLFSAQLSLWSNSQIHTWVLEKPQL